MFIVTISIISFFIYIPFPYEQVIWNLMLILICSEFRYYWLQRIKNAETELEYLKFQISKLRKELFLLRLSHEQLEFNYIVRPYSLRRMILELKEKLLKDFSEEEIMQYFLSLLSQNFKVYKAVLYKESKGKFTPIASIGQELEPLDENDPLIKLVVETEQPRYLPPKALKDFSTDKNYFKYLAVIIAKGEKKKILMTIKDILFVNLNEEVLNYMVILLQYVLEDIEIAEELRKFYSTSTSICNDFDFLKEFFKMYNLNKKLGIPSSIVIFNYEDINQSIKYEIRQHIRGIDMVCFIKEKKLILFLLPFTAIAGAVSFAERIRKNFEDLKLLGIYKVEEPTIEALLDTHRTIPDANRSIQR